MSNLYAIDNNGYLYGCGYANASSTMMFSSTWQGTNNKVLTKLSTSNNWKSVFYGGTKVCRWGYNDSSFDYNPTGATENYGWYGPCTFVTDKNDNLYAWGQNRWGQFGGGIGFRDGNNTPYNYVMAISQVNSNIACAAPSMLFSHFVKKDGTLWASGYYGSHLGIGDPFVNPPADPWNYPYDIPQQLQGNNWKYVTNCAISFDPATGDSSFHFNNQPPYYSTYRYENFSGFLGFITNVKCHGKGCGFAINSSNQLYCWGEVDFFGLSPNMTKYYVPTYAGIDNVKIVSCPKSAVIVKKYTVSSGVTALQDNPPFQHVMVVKNDGTLWGCGSGLYGQLGTGTNSKSTGWVQIGTDSDWVNVACGSFHTLAVKADGTMWSTGLNNRGQLGLSDTNNRNIFTKVGTQTNWVGVLASDLSSYSW